MWMLRRIMPGTTFARRSGSGFPGRLYQIILGVEDAFDIEIPQEEAEKIVTVGDAVRTDPEERCRNEERNWETINEEN